jgi:hypothetical protein
MNRVIEKSIATTGVLFVDELRASDIVVSFHVLSAGSGNTVLAEVSNDGSNWIAVATATLGSNPSSVSNVLSQAASCVPVIARYIRLRCSVYGSGTINIVTAIGDGWPTATAAGGAPALLLDSLSVGAAVAYSSRKLRTAYAGSAMRVRRSSDNAEQDIGFSGNDLDTTALAAFIGANTGTVVTWYDQSGNGADAAQATASWQPRIINAGVLDTINSKASVRWVGGSNRLDFSSVQGIPVSLYMVARFNSYVAGAHLIDGSTLSPRMLLGYGGATNYQMYNGGSAGTGGTTDTTTPHCLVAVFNNASSSLSVDGGANVMSGSIGSQGRGATMIGAGYTTTGSHSWIPEVICFNGALGAPDAALLRAAAQAYWGTP